MKIVDRIISELKPAEYNPRDLTKKQFEDLQKSFKNLDILEPAVINQLKGRENIIISGHQRLKVAESLGITEYPCLEVKFPLKKEKEANIRMNKNTGSWNMDILANEFDFEEIKEFGFEDWELGMFKVNQVNKSDEDAEWAGMPEFEPGEKTLKLTISFLSEEDREEFKNKFKIKILVNAKVTWSTWWPYRERENRDIPHED